MIKTYSVKEIYMTLQGEGANTGRAAVLLRFMGCNLWSGKEEDRAHGKAGCSQWCDTDFAHTNGPGGGKYESAQSLAEAVRKTWDRGAMEHSRTGLPFVVCTGGEPLLQLDTPLINRLHYQNFWIAVETNGTIAAPTSLDWITVSPKAGAALKQTWGQELKLVYPQVGAEPEMYADLPFAYFFLQPMDGPELERNTRACVEYCLTHPQWRLSLQTHKLLGIP